jgi:monoamine oxidase
MSDRGITRRGLVGTAAAAGAGAALPGAAAADERRRGRGRRLRADVVVVGAGLAGLTTADELTRLGHSAIVLEARDRVGGRTWTKRVAGAPVDHGGQWIGPQQERIGALASSLGIATFPTFNTGLNVYFQGGSLRTYEGTIPPASREAIGQIAVALIRLNEMARTVPLEAPWEAPRAAEWDGQTVETWKLANVANAEARLLLDLAIEAVFACEPRDLSLLHALFYIHAGETVEILIGTAGAAQESRLVGGAQLVSRRLARRLGDAVILRSPVREIAQRRRGVEVESDRATVRAERCIVTVPPALAGRIEYDPPLPGLRDQLTQRLPMGSVIKCHAVYDRPFWRDDGLTGQATSDTGPARITFDNSPPSGRPGVLLGFIEGQEAREWGRRPADARRAAVLQSFVNYFGERARTPRAYVDQNWAEEVWSRGCYVGFAPPGVLLDYGEALRAPVGRIHWAGTETATEWTGYMDGAVQSGQRAAAEVHAAL